MQTWWESLKSFLSNVASLDDCYPEVKGLVMLIIASVTGVAAFWKTSALALKGVRWVRGKLHARKQRKLWAKRRGYDPATFVPECCASIKQPLQLPEGYRVTGEQSDPLCNEDGSIQMVRRTMQLEKIEKIEKTDAERLEAFRLGKMPGISSAKYTDPSLTAQETVNCGGEGSEPQDCNAEPADYIYMGDGSDPVPMSGRQLEACKAYSERELREALGEPLPSRGLNYKDMEKAVGGQILVANPGTSRVEWQTLKTAEPQPLDRATIHLIIPRGERVRFELGGSEPPPPQLNLDVSELLAGSHAGCDCCSECDCEGCPCCERQSYADPNEAPRDSRFRVDRKQCQDGSD